MIFRIQGMDCAEEVAVLRREVGPLVGGNDNLAFDVLKGRMTILDGATPVSANDIREAVRRTGMTAVQWRPQEAKVPDAGERHRRQQVWFTSLSGLFVAAGFAIHIWLAGSFTEALRLLESHAGQPVPRLEIVDCRLFCRNRARRTVRRGQGVVCGKESSPRHEPAHDGCGTRRSGHWRMVRSGNS
jgi:Cd2+/Zn2+-exporting ATPase